MEIREEKKESWGVGRENFGEVEYVSNPHMRHDGKVEKISL
jgi:hypothetical protein